MDTRVGLFFLFVLGASWACAARELITIQVVIPDTSDMQINQGQDKLVEKVGRNDNVCTLCEEFATEAVAYLSQNKTQTEIVDILHKSCSQLRTFKQQCITLVDYYVPLFFSELSLIQPQDFCQRVNLCERIALISSQIREDSCGLCHNAVSQVLEKLNDPDTQLDILELLLKGCNSMQKYVKKCKKLVFEYGPLILANAEQFLETTDICTALHACKTAKQVSLADS
ncbi:Saposin-like type B, 1 [Corchorus olitorius]|uniref:Pulmonary surfactant-associated protein B n=1 Tax=Corchorus olitorius TaxID=93759 RepID=A0A1R3HBP5_9ROSI|nr:Saposin-like type B, 1 [Corchorus olitorius]